MDSAYKLFKSVNNKGTPLNELALARAEITGTNVGDGDRAWRLSQAWDDIADNRSEDEMRGYVQTIANAVAKPSKTEDLYALIRRILRDSTSADKFHYSLKYFIENFTKLENANINFGNDSGTINRHIRCLLGYSIVNWRSTALIWLSKNRTNAQHHEFFRFLDGLVLGLTIIHGPRSSAIPKRFSQVIGAIQDEVVLTRTTSPLFLTPDEKEKIRKRMGNPQRTFIKPLLLRLNASITTNGAQPVYPCKVEIEHVLPQKPAQNSDWLMLFPDPEREIFTYRLGNLTLLTRKGNASAHNACFDTKKRVIFGLSENNCFAITNNLCNYRVWDKEAITYREHELTHHVGLIMSL